MDIKELLKKLDISRIAIFFKALFGGGEAVFDYVLDKVNTAIAALPDATHEQIKSILFKLGKLYETLVTLDWLMPQDWERYYHAVMECIDTVLCACEDEVIDKLEVQKAVKAFQIAYAQWRAE